MGGGCPAEEIGKKGDFTNVVVQPGWPSLSLMVPATAYRKYTIDGFELDAVDYLVKPVSFERFFKAITKLNRMMGREVSVTKTDQAPDPAVLFT